MTEPRHRRKFVFLVVCIAAGLATGWFMLGIDPEREHPVRNVSLRDDRLQAMTRGTPATGFEAIRSDGEEYFRARSGTWCVEFRAQAIVFYSLQPSTGTAASYDPPTRDILHRNEVKGGGRLTRTRASYEVRYPGANTSVKPQGGGSVSRKTSYFVGAREDGWRRNVPSYDTLLYRNLYEGIDLVFYYTGGTLKSEYRIQPGADYSKIQIQYSGQDSLQIQQNGDLVVTASGREFVEERPIAWQIIDSRRVERKVEYELASRTECRFKVHDYLDGSPLIIDPVFSSLFGGDQTDGIVDIDSIGPGAYAMAAMTESTNLFSSDSSYNNIYSGSIDLHISTFKLDTSFITLFSTYYGGSKDEHVAFLKRKGDRYYVVGSTNSSNLPVTNDAYQKQYRGGYDIFIAIFNLECTELLYSTYLGGAGDDFCEDACLNDNGNIYITGWTDSFGYPRTPNASQRQYGGGLDDAFLTVMSPDGKRLIYSTFLGASDADEARSVAVDERGRIAVCGVTLSADFLTTGNAIQSVMRGVECGFMTVYDTSDYRPVYSSFFGGWPNGIMKEVASTGDGGFIFVGETTSTDLPVTPGVFQPVKAGTSATDPWDMFLLRVDSNYQKVWCSYLGGSSLEQVEGMEYNYNTIILTAYTYSGDYPAEGALRTQISDVDATLTIIAGNGQYLIFSTLWGGDKGDYPNVCRIFDRKVHVGGFTMSTDMPLTHNAFQWVRSGETDGWFTIFDLDELIVGVQQISSDAPSEVHILGNYPNPFDAGGTSIRYFLKTAHAVQIDVFDAQGRTIFSQIVQNTQQGANTFHYDSRKVESGVYYVRISAGNHVATRKMIHL
ncbi:MAG: T9SS type A sorting domain-containing protein [Ignavibacteriae bacterium]|nr:T9SS type A sorting domain-containing protein [Ignavibacteriota bacterium]